MAIDMEGLTLKESTQDIRRPLLQSLDSKACRFLYVVGGLALGGLERQLFFLLQTLDRQRYKPVVVVWNYCEEDPYVDQIRALHVPVLRLGDTLSRVGKMATFRRMVSRFQPEVVHSCSFYTNMAAWWATLGSSALAVGSVRNSFRLDREETGMILGRLCARWPHAQIFNSKAAKETAESCVTLFKPHRRYVVRNGLDLTYFRMQPYPQNLTLLAVGSLYPRKRWDRLIRIISLISTSGIRFQVCHVGDGPLRGELEELARRLGVEALISFLGPRSDIPELLADSTALVHTAEDEGCPNVIMEAMACGRAIVSMDAGDIPFLIEDGKTGFVVRRGDETIFAERVFQLLSDNQLCRRMGQAARAKAEQEFTLERLVSQTLAVYKAEGWLDVSLSSPYDPGQTSNPMECGPIKK
jgi:glycosyltransferase involved in cell wall biosynthesis